MNVRLHQNIAYRHASGEVLLLDLCTSEGHGPFPIVILVHGGGWGSGDKAGDVAPLFAPLTNAGFAWASINYRLAPAHRWPACLEDVQAAIRWVKSNAADYHVDPNRIALLGYSAGGHLALLATQWSNPAERVRAMIALAAPTDFEQDLPQRGGLSKALQDLLDRPKEMDEYSLRLIREIGPIHHVSADLPPTMIVQGLEDATVPPEQSRAFYERLRGCGVRAKWIELPNTPHRLSEWNSRSPRWTQPVIEFLKNELKRV